ncbi:MAG: hypothetical protein AAF519_08255 [Bacteroidota bacterium]
MTDLNPIDELVLMMVASSDRRASGLEITGRLKKQFKHAVSLGTVLTALKKLECKGVLASKFGKATTRRNKKRARFYTSLKDLDDVIIGAEQIWYTELGDYVEQILEHSFKDNEKK